MRDRGYGRHVVMLGVATVLLVACAGSNPPFVAPNAPSESGGAFPYHKTFRFTGREQSFEVPAGVKWVSVVARGAAGGGPAGGRGGRVHAEVPVVPGEHLAVFVGGTTSAEKGGYNGGGLGQSCSGCVSYGGGGATDIREGGRKWRDRILVAGGGGGQGGDDGQSYGAGGKGGGSSGGSGYAGYACGTSGCYSTGGSGGGGGSQDSGGPGGEPGRGGYGSGGSGGGGFAHRGGHGGDGIYAGNGGGGGGGGYYGGGGGGGGGWGYGDYVGGGGGGGGGSSYIEPSARKFRTWQGWKNATGDGLVVLSWQ